MSLDSKLWALTNDSNVLKIFFSDKTSAGNWTSMRFLSTYMNFRPAVPPEQFNVCPDLLTQPMEDKWSPLHLSKLFLDRARVMKMHVHVVELESAGHYPLEQPGMEQMGKAIIAFLRDIEARSKCPKSLEDIFM